VEGRDLDLEGVILLLAPARTPLLPAVEAGRSDVEDPAHQAQRILRSVLGDHRVPPRRFFREERRRFFSKSRSTRRTSTSRRNCRSLPPC
jgi:hypothetical protein